MRATSGLGGRRPALLLVLAGLAAGAALVAASAHADPDELRSQADRLRERNAELDAAAAAALLDLYALESDLHRAEQRVERLRSQLDALEEQQASAKRHLGLARQAQATAQEALAERVRALYVEGAPDPLEVVLGSSTLDGFIDAIDTVNRVAEHDRQLVEQVQATRAELRAALAALAEREQDVRGLAARAEDARATLAEARSEKSGYLDSLREEQGLNAQEIAALDARAAEAEQLAAELTPDTAGDTGGADGGSVDPAVPVVDPGPASGGDSSSAPGRQVSVTSTMYCLRGTTATGIPVAPGVVATDPAYIPLGTRMYIPGYGEGVAADTGGAVKGWFVDMWVASCARANAYGKRTITITIYD